MKKKELSAKSQDLLRAQTITQNEPGTVLRDFETFLQFIASHPLEAAGLYDMLPINCLSALNEQMSQPLRIEMKRPMHKSFPHLSVLFLLARAGGFICTDGQSGKRLLRLYEPALQQWQTLNATERYFTLLDIYLWHANGELINDRRGGGRFLKGMSSEALMVWSRHGEGGVKVPAGKQQENLIFTTWFHYYAFFELFGFVIITQGKPEAGKGWRIKAIKPTPCGLALFELVKVKEVNFWNSILRGDQDDDEDEPVPQPNQEVVFNHFQPHLQPYFPEWQRCLAFKDDSGPRAGVFQFKASLGKAWRRIAIDARDTLEDLSLTVLEAFDFDNDHLHRFIYRDRFGLPQEINHPSMDEPPFSDQVPLQDLSLPLGGRMTFIFDFGDHWEFDLTLEKIDPTPFGIPKPKVIESHGKAPEQYPSWDDGEDDYDEDDDE
ncbi:MAG: plasmid pRiA4b ORF-3 family protein [Acidobacteria bacterium]|nr:plasmid pRiA4b ORF-3 family protein [Acidobacteriota bacterium]